MKQKYAVIILFTLIVASSLTSLRNYKMTEQRVNDDMQQALALTMAQQQSDVISQDTVRTFNRHLQIAALRGRATIAVDAHCRHFKAYAYCSEATIFSLSNQRPTSVLWMMTILWIAYFCYRRRKEMLPFAGMTGYGGLNYAQAEGHFYDAQGQRIKLTPMQQQLMEMFFRSNTYMLTKAEICEALWPKKEDASETLYTLIRRLKPIIEQHSDLKIEVDRGRSYELKIK